MQAVWRSCLVSALLLAGCATTKAGFTDTAFFGKDAGYSVDYSPAGVWMVMPNDWELENYFENVKGKPTREKNQGIYQDKMEWIDEGGVSSKPSYVVNDLKFRHGSGSILVVSTVAVPPHLRRLRLSAVAEQWANSYSGMQFSFKSGEAHRSASKILESKARNVGGRAAREVTFDVVDVDQLQLDADAPRARVRAIFIQAPLTKEFISTSLSAPSSAPAFLFVGLASTSSRNFDNLVGDYESLLARIHVSKQAAGGEPDSPDRP